VQRHSMPRLSRLTNLSLTKVPQPHPSSHGFLQEQRATQERCPRKVWCRPLSLCQLCQRPSQGILNLEYTGTGTIDVGVQTLFPKNRFSFVLTQSYASIRTNYRSLDQIGKASRSVSICPDHHPHSPYQMAFHISKRRYRIGQGK
jgi:hypothetical protein